MKFYNFECKICHSMVEWAYQEEYCSSCLIDKRQAERAAQQTASESKAILDARNAAEAAYVPGHPREGEAGYIVKHRNKAVFPRMYPGRGRG